MLQALADLLARLDADQQKVAAWTPADGNLRVVAAAGSGKTTTISALVGNLIAKGVDPSRIVVTTFTAKAGHELKNRIKPVVPAPAYAALRIGTFHSLALRGVRSLNPGNWQMRFNVDMPGKERAPDVPSGGILWRAITQFGTVPGTLAQSLRVPNADPPSYARAVDLFRSDMIDDPALLTPSVLRNRGVRLTEFAKAWQMYLDAKRALGAWDYADCLAQYRDALGIGVIPADADVVIVDEAQDNTQTQIEIARFLAGTNGRVILVGDARQTVHVWRGAYPELFLNANKGLKAKTLPLNTNYRSVPAIVDLSNAVANGYSWALGTTAKASRSGTEGVAVSGNHTDEGDEADWIAGEIEAGIANGKKAGYYAVLTRTNAALLDIQAALVARNIDNVVVGDSTLFTSREAMDVMAYCVLAYHDALPSLEQVVNRPTRFLGKDYIASVKAALPMCGGDMIRACEAAGNTVKRGSQAGVANLVQTLRNLRGKRGWVDVVLEVESLLVGAAVARRDRDKGELLPPDEDTPGAYRAVCRAARRFTNVVDFVEFADRCSSNGKVGADDALPDDKVTLSTIHRSKGLEWGHVFVQATEGVLPHKRSMPASPTAMTGAEIESEVRLFYVAATRGKDNATFTWFGQFDRDKQVGGPSRFLRHFGLLSAGGDDVDAEGTAE